MYPLAVAFDRTFENLSGEAHSSLTNTTFTVSEQGTRLSLANLRTSLNAGLNPAAASAQVGGTMGSTGLPAFGDKPAWVSIVGNWQKLDGNSNSAQLDQKLKADYDTHSTQLFAEVGYLIGQPDGQNIEPFAGLSVTHLSSDAFKEKGGSAALRSSSASETQTVSTLGVRGQTPYEFGNFGATVYGSLGWQHAFNRTSSTALWRLLTAAKPLALKA